MENKLSIEDGNKLIGEFMGYKMFDKRYPRNHGIGAPEAPDWFPKKDMIIQKAKYHLLWDWLMPVIEKIEGKEIDLSITVIIENDKCGVYRYKDSFYEQRIFVQRYTTKIEATWLAVIGFIQWYNKISLHDRKRNNETGTKGA